MKYLILGVTLAAAFGWTAITSRAQGSAPATIIVGNYDGAGDQLGSFVDGAWTIQRLCPECANPLGPLTFQWGTAGDLPVVGDFDHDGKADPTIYRPSTKTFWILRSGCGYTCYWQVQ